MKKLLFFIKLKISLDIIYFLPNYIDLIAIFSFQSHRNYPFKVYDKITQLQLFCEYINLKKKSLHYTH